MSKIISFEGIDGVGKTSHIQKLSKFLTSHNISHACTSELGSKPVFDLKCMLIKQKWTPNEELLIIATARAWHWRNFVIPALQKNQLVILDRFIHSTFAYQGSSGVSFDQITYVNEVICQCREPDYVIYIAGNPRRNVIEKDLIESRDQEFFNRVEEIYHNMIKDNWLTQSTIDSFDTVQNNINEFVLKKIKL